MTRKTETVLQKIILALSSIVIVGFGLGVVSLGYLAGRASHSIGWTGVALIVAALAV